MALTLRERATGKYQAAAALARFFRSFRNWREVWAAYRTGGKLPRLVLRNGLILDHGAGDDPILLFHEIFVEQCYTGDGFYEPAPEDLVMDLGGNIGVFALFLQAKARGVRVHSFEPAPETRARLERNVVANGLEGLVTVHPFAVTDVPGTVALKHAPLAGHRSLFGSRFVASDAVETVPALSLAQAVERVGGGEVDLLKIDVEGAEIEILEGADAETLARFRRVVVEYHDLFRPGCRERVTRVLDTHGFAPIETVAGENDPGIGLIRARRAGVIAGGKRPASTQRDRSESKSAS